MTSQEYWVRLVSITGETAVVLTPFMENRTIPITQDAATQAQAIEGPKEALVRYAPHLHVVKVRKLPT